MIEHETPARLSEGNRALRGDVETIFAKALEKDKQRRYQSAADFAADIRRYLDNEPVIARPATALYQMRNFARRNPALVGGISVVFVVLIAATAVSLAFWQQSVTDKMAAQRRADHLEAVSRFLKVHFLEAPFPWRDGAAVTIVDPIDQAARELDTAFTVQPRT